MKLRTRLAWSFGAMLLVPLAMMIVIGGVVQELWLPEGNLEPIEVFNTILRDNPDSLLTPEGFEKLDAQVPPFVVLGVQVGGAWVQTSAGFEAPSPRLFRKTLFQWRFALTDGREAKLVVQLHPHQMLGSGMRWFFFVPLLAVLIFVLTNGTLTWRVSRTILRPLGQLEAAARKLGEGELDPSPLPASPPEFRSVGTAFDQMRLRLKASLEERERLEEERRTWVASMSHDLRTPLAVVRGYAEGLRDGMPKTPDKQKKYHAVILERALQMERLVDDLFQWARWDWGHPQLHPVTLDLGAELDRAAADWLVDWPTLNVHWTRPDQPVTLTADPIALRRIFDNLARNAVGHAGPRPQLHIELNAAPRAWVLTFRDEGPGIPAEVLPHVFERFYRGDPARNPELGGGGLGLTISRALAQALGGTLQAQNAPQGGALFTLTLAAG